MNFEIQSIREIFGKFGLMVLNIRPSDFFIRPSGFSLKALPVWYSIVSVIQMSDIQIETVFIF